MCEFEFEAKTKCYGNKNLIRNDFKLKKKIN